MLLGPDGNPLQVPSRATGPDAGDAATAALSLWNPFSAEARQGMRKAMDAPMAWLGKYQKPVFRTGAGLTALGALMSAAGEFENAEGTTTGNTMRALGSGAGGLAGIPVGAAIGQAVIPIPGVGAAVGALLASMAGSGLGRGAGDIAARMVEGSPEDRAFRRQLEQQKTAQRAALDMQLESAQRMLPIQQQVAQVALANEQARQKIATDDAIRRLQQQLMGQTVLNQQAAGNQQVLSAQQALLGGLGLG